MNKQQPPKLKKSANPYDRQLKRNQLIFIALSVILILSMLISLIRL